MDGQSSQSVCKKVKVCGGCQMMHLPYEQQLERKQQKVERLMGKYHSVEPIIGMQEPYHYRNKVQAAFGIDSRGNIISGIYQSNSHRIVAVDECLLEDLTADRIITDIRKMMPKFRMTAYSERNDRGWLRHVLVKRSFSTNEVMVVLVATSPIFKVQKPFLKALLEQHPEITTIVLNVNDSYTSLILGKWEKTLYGKGYIEDVLCGMRFRISAKSFYQINAVQTEVLYNTAISYAQLTGKERVLDAYCGTGTIGLVASRHAERVLGVEINREAVKDAISNAKANQIENIWFTCADAGQYMMEMAAQDESCDVVFMDPPRAGSDKAFLSSLCAMRPKRIVYVSCNPETLERDCVFLVNNGYRISKIQPVDMFPHTEHVECICLLSKKNTSKKNWVEIGLDAEDYYKIKESHAE